MSRTPDIVVTHDYLTQRGGAERVALELAQQLGAREIVTSAYVRSQTFEGFSEFAVRQSDSRTVRALAADPRRALPFLAAAWSRQPPVDAHAVVCSSSGWAHAVPTTPRTMKVVYCHNPARWLYQRSDYLRGHPVPVKAALALFSPSLRRWDHAAAKTADVYLANSTSVRDRIRAAYGIDAEVLHPPVSVDTGGGQDPAPSVEEGFFLAIGRPRGYKGIARLVEAFARMPHERLVVVGMDPDPLHPPNVVGVGRVTEERLRWLYAHARALVSVSREDFGLTPIEANAFGTPSLLLRAGGFLDSTSTGVSGAFIEDDTPEGIVAAVRSYPTDWDRAAVRRHANRFSPGAFGARIREIIGSGPA